MRNRLHGYIPSRIKRDFSQNRMAADAIRAYRLARKNKRRTAALVGYYGYGNLGDEETLRALSKILAERQIALAYPSSNDKLDMKMARRTLSLFCAIAKSDLVILGGGNLLQNETSRRSLIYYCETIRFARLCHKPIYLLSSGLGEIRGTVWRKYAMKALSHCSVLGLRTSRDILELNALSSLYEKSFGYKSVKMPDLCFSIPPHLSPKKDVFAVIPANGDGIGAEEIRKAAHRLGLSPQIFVIFPQKDTERAKKLSRELGAPLFFAKNREEAIALIGKCRLTISERLHGAIFSLIAKTPALIDTRREKCEALLGEIELTARRSGCRSPLFPAALLSSPLLDTSQLTGRDFDLCLAALRRELFATIDGIL